jgi:hypothetical protein
MSANKISNKWVADSMTKYSKFPQNQDTKNQQKNYSQKNYNQSATISINPIPGYICRRFNNNLCPHQNDDSCGAPWNNAVRLKHICAFKLPTTNLCLKRHSLKDHK